MRLTSITIVSGLALLGSGCLLLVEPPALTGGNGSGGGGSAPETGWTDLAVRYGTVCALDVDGAMWCGGGGGDMRPEDPGPFVSISAGQGGFCAVELAGLLRCGFDGESGFELSESYVEVSGGTSAGCGLMDNGTPRCWPEPFSGPGTFDALGSGDTAACGIAPSGALQCWSVDGVIFDEVLNDVPGGSYTRVNAYDHIACAIASSSGDITCWGYDFDGILPGAPAGSYVDLDLGFGGACAVTDAGSIVCWGEDANDPNSPQFFPPVDSFVRVSIGSGRGCGITADTRLVCWG